MEPVIEQTSWSAVRDRVASVNPSIAELIGAIKPNGDRYPLFIARYPYGSKFVDKGTLMLPSKNGTLVPLHDKTIPEKIRELVGYATIPFAIWLNSTSEVFIEFDDRCIPLNVFHPGSVCGLWEILDTSNPMFSKRIWSLSAGTRSLFTLPKINDASGLKRIEKKYGFHSAVLPKTIFEQVQLFAQIANSQKIDSHWTSEVLIFSKEWFKEESDKHWLMLRYSLLKEEWQKSLYWRNKVTFDLIGQMFAHAQTHRNLRPNSYLIDTVMHLISIAMSASPGFEPVVNNEACAPIKLIQDCLTMDYGLKTYVPTIMKPNYLTSNQPLYYSLQIPTMLGSSSNLRKPHSVLDDLRMIKRLLESLYMTLERNHPSIFELIKNVHFEFFHTEKDAHHKIEETKNMPLKDKRLIAYHEKGRLFCDTSSFFRGCVSITKQE